MATRTFPFVSQMRLQGREEGRQEGLAALVRTIFKILDDRGIDIDDSSRTRIQSCGDVEVLEAWVGRSLHVTTASELFGQL